MKRYKPLFDHSEIDESCKPSSYVKNKKKKKETIKEVKLPNIISLSELIDRLDSEDFYLTDHRDKIVAENIETLFYKGQLPDLVVSTKNPKYFEVIKPDEYNRHRIYGF